MIQQRQPDPHQPGAPVHPSGGPAGVLAYTEPDRAAAHGGVVAAAAAAEAREAGNWSIGDFRLATMLIGTIVGGGIALTNGSKDERLIFVIVAALLGAASGEAFGFGLSRWAEVRRMHRIVKRRVWFSLLTVIAVAAGLVAATPLLLPEVAGGNGQAVIEAHNLTARGIAISALAIIGGLPSAATLAAVKQVAADPLPGTPGQQLDALLRLRRMCARMLSQLGILVLLVMGVNAAARTVGIDLDPGVVIFSGVVASFVVGTMYAPTAATLRRRGQIFVERHFALDHVPVAELVDAAENKGKLEKLLSLDQTTFGELKAGLVVLSPVVAGAVALMIQNLK
ncbi:hypothetical protein [Catellatospora sp. IY07-71]|uniref:hypothetical protein n=1 Tax=Catellatospora sp. IY07-71 TaxID=2728827 RepID=UPI001BB3AA97|nr:hypothetical protein [Catellatospora sp. IY07-71]